MLSNLIQFDVIGMKRPMNDMGSLISWVNGGFIYTYAQRLNVRIILLLDIKDLEYFLFQE